MAYPSYRYDAPADSGIVARPSIPGYLTPEAPSFSSYQPLGSTDLRGVSSDFPQREINVMRSGPYGLHDPAGIRVHPEPNIGGTTAGASVKGHSSPLQNANLIVQRREAALGISPTIPDMINEMPKSLGNFNGSPVVEGQSNILFVEGLPTDCTRREVAHLFRPFIGYREIRVIHKEPRRSGDRAMVLCFVEFIDAKCAVTAMEALQGYKFDDKKLESPALRIQFAHFPFRPSNGDEQRIRIPR